MSLTLRPRLDDHGLGLTGQRARDRLIQRLQAEGIRDPRVLEVMRMVPRHLFVDEAIAGRAYEDNALPIGSGQTISQPYIVAKMTESLIEPGIPARALEIGTGSGYQAAVLAALGIEVFTIERMEPLLRQARRRFRQLGLEGVRSRHDDGRLGWPDASPFPAIMVTAAASRVEPAWLEQLAEGGLMLAPVGEAGGVQRLRRIQRVQGEFVDTDLGAVSFVPVLPGIV
ncbi:protein-L-isoaspartate(D-aspartate) O-methyltransferase [Pseudofulvimonas gallinarii]|uniref:Protein-L-isoaspartate O-methyltransferase n=1 Tax=Pseudofulvimonas gallinarii TaxID=634155 RepID=A0A4S3KRP5_9GAMM|nr:protein-L-isoaspartate(D-aspartate) O-methyltransferase [Pseudofulvimonas gallinarii]TCT00689.1 protein-L-isoaspartate(D-aspartate) O-methyltransferase [Pseudofulvimonas gallinarii]THD11775.1 protein-L-isoaspartate O-methyltransferase [Pseudofulvimonas gallinarii]